MRILAINTDWGSNEYRKRTGKVGGVGYYRLKKPLEALGEEFIIVGANLVKDHLNAKGTDEELLQSYIEFVRGFDVVITKVQDSPRAIIALVMACEKAHVPLVLDVDDNVFDVLPTQPAYEKGYQKGGLKKAYAITGMSMVNAIFCSTQPLVDKYKKILKESMDVDKEFFVLPNCNDIEDWNYKSPKNKEKVVIGWHGSTTHDQDLALALPAISRLLDEYPNLYLELMGGVTRTTKGLFSDFSDYAIGKVRAIGGTKAWDGFPELLMKQRWDIGIAPLIECDFNQGKSHIKWMELAMKEIPVIASKVYPYSEEIQGIPVIEHGKTGFLVTKNWYSCLKMLIEDKELREKVGKEAKKAVIKNWQYKDHIYKWKEALCTLTTGTKI